MAAQIKQSCSLGRVGPSSRALARQVSIAPGRQLSQRQRDVSRGFSSDKAQQVVTTFTLQKYVVTPTSKEAVFLVGSHPALGAWDVEKAIQMQCSPQFEWSAEVSMAVEPDANMGGGRIFGYKYVVMKKKANGQYDTETLKWQEGKSQKVDCDQYIALSRESLSQTVITSFDLKQPLHLSISDSWDRLTRFEALNPPKKALEAVVDAKVAAQQIVQTAKTMHVSSPAAVQGLLLYRSLSSM